MIIGSNILNKTPYGELGKNFQKIFSTNFFSAFFASMYLCLCASTLAEFAWLVGGQGPSTRQPPAVEAAIVVHYSLIFLNLVFRVDYFRVQYVNARKVKTLCLVSGVYILFLQTSSPLAYDILRSLINLQPQILLYNA